MVINEKQMAFAKKVYGKVKNREISPIFVTAQAVLETNWGAHINGKNNLFNITKGLSWTGQVDMVEITQYFVNSKKTLFPPEKVLRKVRFDTNKWQYKVIRAFRHYESIDECIEDYYKLFKNPLYDEALNYKDNAFMFALKVTDIYRNKYSISPEYYKKLRSVIISLNSLEPWLKKTV